MTADAGFARGAPRLLLRLEGAAAFAGAIALYDHLGYSWWLFAVLLLVPDLSMVGYLANAGVGAATYNAAHSYVAPALLAVVGAAAPSSPAWPVAAVWFAHIGMDRLLGYGLKYPTGFGDTHLGQIGRARVTAPPS